MRDLLSTLCRASGKKTMAEHACWDERARLLFFFRIDTLVPVPVESAAAFLKTGATPDYTVQFVHLCLP